MVTRLVRLATLFALVAPWLAAGPTALASEEPSPSRAPERKELAPGSGGTGRAAPVVVAPGSYELRPELGGAVSFANFGHPTVGSNHLVLGLTLSRNRTSALAFAWGLHYILGDRINGARASWEARYRFFGLNPWIVPVVFGGLAAQFGTPEDYKKAGDRTTQLVGGFRGGLALDLMISDRIFPTFQAAFEVGPRFLPNAMMYGGALFTFGLNFVL